VQKGISALPPKADIRKRERHFCLRGHIHKVNNQHSVEFWNAVRQTQGLQSAAAADGSVRTLGAEFLAHCDSRVAAGDLAASTKSAYEMTVAMATEVWGDLPFAGLRGKHVQAFCDKLTPGKARNFVNKCLAGVAHKRTSRRFISRRGLCFTPKQTSVCRACPFA
jgi:hypothetical protein